MPRFVPYVVVIGIFAVALLYLQFRDRSYLEDVARAAYPPPPVSRVILPPSQEPQGPLLYVDGNRVALRGEPGLQADVLERFNKGRSVRQTDVQGNWVQVRVTDSGRQGWISSRYLTSTNPLALTASN
ncbi:SH3 domain-containing protein [Roseibium sp. SCP14]|uniref:SH3 domain-containing protein n=1 Tax=Roseibium sp. SCP14 TaxID=3141375 RepID=UPI003338D65B